MTGSVSTAARQSLTRAAPFAQEVTPDERTLDDVLADSFPASDPPPWTLGVHHTHPPPLSSRGEASRKVKVRA